MVACDPSAKALVKQAYLRVRPPLISSLFLCGLGLQVFLDELLAEGRLRVGR